MDKESIEYAEKLSVSLRELVIEKGELAELLHKSDNGDFSQHRSILQNGNITTKKLSETPVRGFRELIVLFIFHLSKKILSNDS